MKKTITLISLTALLAAGCATQSHTVTATDAAGVKTVTQDKSSQSDNAALTVVGQGVKLVGDVVTAILPPFIPVIVDGLTKPITTPATK